ncbi:MAG: M14 family zinc carboxypeptidase [Bacteroidota bacterium]
MNKIQTYLLTTAILLSSLSLVQSQDYFLERFQPYDADITTPEEYFGYGIGEYHTRHDMMVSYLELLASQSSRASLIDYGKSHEQRRLVMLQVSDEKHISNLEEIQRKQLAFLDPNSDLTLEDMQDHPILVNLGYSVHGNEPSTSEAAMLAAYVLVASSNDAISRYRDDAVVIIDPALNPDGRDRHTQWANALRSQPFVTDPMDAEHNETWPRGRTNHYWFDLNRDWLLAVHPESRGKLEWYHQWYPGVVGDFHEMGTNSSYFFEPMKDNGSLHPIMPIENYTSITDSFAQYYTREMDDLGSFYFTKEVFDGTYPGYGSSYPDLQGGLALLFEQASSRGHAQDTDFGVLTFPYTIRHQFFNSIATVEAAVDHRALLQSYQRSFFTSAIENAKKSGIQAYIIGEKKDVTRMNAFIELLLRHQIRVYRSTQDHQITGQNFEEGSSYIIPTGQPQYRMVQTMFETYEEYRDSVFYDASAWSLANAYDIDYAAVRGRLALGEQVVMEDLALQLQTPELSNYAYLVDWSDYHSPAVLQALHDNDVNVMVAQKAFENDGKYFANGTLVIPVQRQDIEAEQLHGIVSEVSMNKGVVIHGVSTGYSTGGIDLGSRYVEPLIAPRAAMLIGDGVSGYEAGFVWHLLDTRVSMPITKIKTSMFGRAQLDKYTTLVLVSGSYNMLDSADVARIKSWTAKGNTLITIGRASSWAISKKLVNESLLSKEPPTDSLAAKRLSYIKAREIQGKEALGGTIFEVDIDITHPIGFGYDDRRLPVYRNNTVWLKPSKNPYCNVAVYAEDPHIDGFVTPEVLAHLKKTSSIVVSRVGRGRAIMFAEDPNFRGTWYGTNKLFLNAIFFGDLVRIP